jgi:porphobilinogen synthase
MTQARYDIPMRLRRLRLGPSVRALVQETRVTVDQLIAPLFVREAAATPEPVASMPGVFRRSVAGVVDECCRLREAGIRAVAIFPCLDAGLKDATGSRALDPNGLVLRTVRAIKEAAADLVVITDVALDPYTSHGHDGILDGAGRDVDNDRTVEVLARMAVLQAGAGADWVAPSDMMDGRVRAIRQALDAAGATQTAILAYAAKFASAFYGPFRDAVGSRPAARGAYLDKRTYQLNPANAREAVREALLDAAEGADLLLVKPAGPYLDVIHALRAETRLPLVAYQVSGEYAQLQGAARLGWLELEPARDEALLAIRRAGADLIVTYFAGELARAGRASEV